MAVTTDTDGAAPDADVDPPPRAAPERDEWFYEFDTGWFRQRETWSGNGLAIVHDDYELEVTPPHSGVNAGFGIAIAASGAYRRSVRGADQVVDVNTGFLRFAGDEVSSEHFMPCRGATTHIAVDPGICGGFDKVAAVPAFSVTPRMALTHVRLLRAQDTGADDATIETLALELLSAAIEQHDDRAMSWSRRTTGDARRRLVAAACEVIHEQDGRMSLVDIAKQIGSSPFHLSRVFREITGVTIPQYRRRLRTHEAVRRISEGEHDLAALAVSTGFADHSHMTRSIVDQYGEPPSRLRDMLQVYMAAGAILPR